jgi:endonuclease/exonuclease/phosphatase family metal-dependent hydrolase
LLSLLTLAAGQPACAESFSVLSQNMNRLFDDVDDGNQEQILPSAEFRRRIAGAVHKFAEEYALPQVIALQEVENLNVLRQISAGIRRQYAIDYQPILIPGQDISSINLAYLVRADVSIRKTSQLFRDQRLPFDGSRLFSRPPLRLEACLQARCLSLVNLHLRSMRGIDSAHQGTRVAYKRLHQAQTVALWVNRFQQANPDAWLVLLGDFNALTPSDKHVDVAGIIRGNPDSSRARLPARDLVETDLLDLTRRIPPDRRYSFIFRHTRQQLDYLYASEALATAIDSIRFGAIDYAFSDHAGLLAVFRWQQ